MMIAEALHLKLLRSYLKAWISTSADDSGNRKRQR